jgi:hypothetical protein
MNEMWGGVAPDLFIFIFDPAVCPDWITDQTHGTSSDTFMKVWNAAGTNAEDALAYGFVSHNEDWGADHIAHESGITFGQDAPQMRFGLMDDILQNPVYFIYCIPPTKRTTIAKFRMIRGILIRIRCKASRSSILLKLILTTAQFIRCCSNR